MDDEQRVALVETRTQGDDGSPAQLIRYQFGNHLGSACLELDADAAVISYEEYYPYGSTSYQAGRSRGRGELEALSVHGQGARRGDGAELPRGAVLRAVAGEVDGGGSDGSRGGINRFAYSDGNPMNLSDPGGMAPADPSKFVLTERPGVTAHLRGGGTTFTARSRDEALRTQSDINTAAAQADAELYQEELADAIQAERHAKKAIRGTKGQERARLREVYNVRKAGRKALEFEESEGLRGHGTEWRSDLYDLGGGKYAVTASLPGGSEFTWEVDKPTGGTEWQFAATPLTPTPAELSATGAKPGGTLAGSHHSHQLSGDPEQRKPHEKQTPEIDGSDGLSPSDADRKQAAELHGIGVDPTMTNQRGRIVVTASSGTQDRLLRTGLGSATDLRVGEAGAVTSAKRAMGAQAFSTEVSRQKSFLRGVIRTLLAQEQLQARPRSAPAGAIRVRR